MLLETCHRLLVKRLDEGLQTELAESQHIADCAAFV
jgi:hypothetical protein